MKNEYIQIRISEEDKKALAEISEQLDIPASQIVREGVRQKIADLKVDPGSIERINKKLNTQANFRLPESLINELKSVSEQMGETQTNIVRDGLQAKVETLKKRIQRNKDKETQEVATI